MIIDAYSNISASGATPNDPSEPGYRAERLVKEMDDAAVDRGVATSFGQRVDNTYVEEAAERFPDRLIPFAQINPCLPNALPTLDALGERNVFRGLKLHPTRHGYPFADHKLLDPVFEKCQLYRWVVLVNALDDPFCAPLAVEEIARGFPDVPVLLAHMGTAWNANEALIVAARSEHIYLETSTADLLSVREAYTELGSRKIVMGTDWPANSFTLERQKIREAIPDDGDRERVEGRNLAELLDL